MVKDYRSRSRRSVNQFGDFKFVRIGLSLFHWSDLYHELLTISWPRFLAAIGLVFLAVNILFAIAYLAGGGGIENAQPGSFIDAFSFSVQTLATIGYGAMYPKSAYAHLLVTIEVWLGMLTTAMATGLMFARFSRPTARVLFSRVAVVCPYRGVPTLMFRVANQRSSWIVEAQVRVSLLLPNEVTAEGHSIRRLCDLKLVRAQTPIMALTWSVMHPIDEDSPLYGIDTETFAQWDSQIIVTLTGLDDTLSQTIHTRYTYEPELIIWNMRLVDVVTMAQDRTRQVDYTHFHDVEPLWEGTEEMELEGQRG